MTATDRATGTSPRTNRSRFNAGQLRHTRRMLQAQRAALTTQLSQLDRGDIGGANPLHPAEARSIAENVHKAVADIDFALAQITSGRYGVCRDCDQPIALARLEALPATTLCLPCQRRHEGRHR